MEFLILFLLILEFKLTISDAKQLFAVDCSNLRIGQYLCPDPDYDLIDPRTQQPWGCKKDNYAAVKCKASDGIICKQSNDSTFWKQMPCKWTNGYSFETALFLSIFFGMFGADRFYLGYLGIGLLKFCSLGFMFVGQFIDVILIAAQVITPADGSYYVIPYYGPGIEIIKIDNWTYYCE